MRRAGIVLAALGLVLLPARALALDDQLLGALKRVQAVHIDGNRAIKDSAIRKVIKTGAGSFLGLRSLPLYRPDFLRSDALTIQNLYARRGFLSAAVAAQADSGDQPNRVIVTYHITEGLRVRVRTVTFDSSGAVPPAVVRAAIHLRPGQPYDPVQVVLDRTSIAERYADRGYFPTITTHIDGDSVSVAIHFGIVAGPGYRVREVSVVGVREVDTLVVKRELLLRRGDLFRRDRLIKSSERLYDTGLFNSVAIEPVRADTLLGVVDLTARVRERKPRWIEGGVGAGSTERPSLSAEWGNRNLWGKGRALTADATYGYNRPQIYRTRAALAYTEPWMLGRRVRGRVVPSFERGFEDFGGVTYVQEAWGLSFGLARDFTFSHSRLSLTLDNTWTKPAQRPEERDSLGRALPDTALAPPYARRWTAAYDQDLRDDHLDARQGALTHAAAQLAGSTSNGQGRYLRLDGSEAYLFPVRASGSIGARLRSVWIGGLGAGPAGDAGTIARVPLLDRLRIGGSSSVRGYHENGIDDGANGGRFLLNANLEYRFPLRGILSGALFLDGGNVWRRMSEVKFRRIFQATGRDGTYGTADMRWSIGLGLRARTPIGPLRFDYGRRLRTDESDLLALHRPDRGGWHFGIGQLF